MIVKNRTKMEINLVEKATVFATEKHIKQFRKFNGEPYVEHPKRVAQTVSAITFNDKLVAAALLHDTIEDTDTTYEEIVTEFGAEVADLVRDLTSDKEEIKIVGKDIYLTEKMNKMNPDALLIKLADRLDNVSDLTMKNEEWSRAYAVQTNYILTNLSNPILNIDHEMLIRVIRVKITPFL